MTDHASFADETAELQPGDRLYFYTDGVIEAVDRAEEEFGYERLLRRSNASATGPCAWPSTSWPTPSATGLEGCCATTCYCWRWSGMDEGGRMDRARHWNAVFTSHPWRALARDRSPPFAPDGPETCSGPPVVRYSAGSLARELGAASEVVEWLPHAHTTPSGRRQSFQYWRFRRALTRDPGDRRSS